MPVTWIDFPGPDVAPDVTGAFLQRTADSVDRTTYTFAAQNLGTAVAGRLIVVAVHARATGATALTVSSASIGGVSATIAVQLSSTATDTSVNAIVYAVVPTGTTGDIVVTLSRASNRCMVGAWRLVDLVSTTPTDTDSSSAANPTCSLTVSAGGYAIGAACVAVGGGSATWTGLDEVYDAITEALTHSGASKAFPAADTPTITATLTAGSSPIGAFASWR